MKARDCSDWYKWKFSCKRLIAKSNTSEQAEGLYSEWSVRYILRYSNYLHSNEEVSSVNVTA